MRISLRTTLLLASFATPLVADDLLEQLTRNSPFVPAAGATNNAAAPTGELELRGIVKQGGVMWFSVFDPTTNESQWIREDDPSTGFVIRSYDPATDTLVLDQGSRQMSLSLPRLTTIATTANNVEPPVIVAGPQPINAVNAAPPGGPNAVVPAPLDPAGRERLLQEIRRRRAERLSQRQENARPQ